MHTHLTEDDLVLHYYGEMDAAAEARTAAHLSDCAPCQSSYTRLQRVLAAVEAAPAPELPEGFERTVWARLEPGLTARRPGWLSWLLHSPGGLAWAAAIVVLVTGAFFAGRWQRASDAPAGSAASAAQVRERILLIDLGEHLDRSQMVLVELVSAEGDGQVDISGERARAEDLLAANRLYRQTALESGDKAVAQFLDELERVLVDVAASPENVTAADLENVQHRIEARSLLFKVRVISSEVRERQKATNLAQIRPSS